MREVVCWEGFAESAFFSKMGLSGLSSVPDAGSW